MARVRTVDFLPEIFQTPVNRQFLNATLDQLTQEPKFEKTQGYVGRRVGPGVNPADRYVVEPTAQRNDYQLEPGVISLDPDTSTIADAITYPGINDALKLSGADVDNADRLYKSEYYTWDPFVDFDKFVNYQQYYWLPAGPDDVDVSATTIPLTDNFVVDRANGVYTFSGQQGNNPTLTLVRGGNYTFQVAQNAKETVNYRVGNQNINAYLIDFQPNPTLTLIRGNTYTFTLVLDGAYPFYIKTEPTIGNNNTYDSGVSRNGAVTGTVTFVVPQDAPDVLYYASGTQFNMRGQINIIDGTPGTGPGFWIQSEPGVNGVLPYAPNISSRTVLGVTNNGEDLGTVSFNVPLATAQDFYYSLTTIAPVDLVTNLQFDQINNRFVEPFLQQYGGIDGITNLNGRTVVFLNQTLDAQDGGWEITTQFDPLPNVGNVQSPTGSYDSTTFDQTTPITSLDQRYSVWQIEYVTTTDGTQFMQLNSVRPVNQFEKFNILFGTQYASTTWFRNAEGFFEQVPLLTAVKDVLWYQDGTDPEIFGQIRLIDEELDTTIDVNDIIGKKNYTSPNGVVFTNGLKVTFRGSVIPASYANQTYYVEGVGTAIKLLPVTDFVTPETYTNSLTVPYDSTPYDVGNFDATLNAPLVPDYLTINRASPDLNAWSRSNRWFHIDVINATAAYNNTIPVIDNSLRGRRPILEFRAGTRLFEFGTQGKQPVNIVDFDITDALGTINGSLGYAIDGYELVSGSRVIFAADEDPQVRNKIYEVQFITPDTVPPLIAQPVINLVPASDATVLINQTVVCLTGNTLQGKSFYYDGVVWLPAQDKISVNQAPLFDVFDSAGISYSNREKYASSTFRGSKLFSYAPGTGPKDPVLGFPLRYLSLANIGDIVFENNLYNDTFEYVANNVGTTQNISDGFVRQYSNRVDYIREIGWQTAATLSQVRQQFQFTYDGRPLKLDVKVSDTTTVPAVQLYVNAEFQNSDSYTVTTTDTTTTINLLKVYVPGDIIEVAVLSDQVSKQGFYQVPINLSNNPLNKNSREFTLGTVRSHYGSIAENLVGLQGPVNGANNTRDLGNIVPYGLQILQQSSPLTFTGYFQRNLEYDIFSAIEYNSREYIKFKSLLLETVIRNDYGDMSASDILDAAVAELTRGRTNLNPFYWSDMLPSGSVYTETANTITPISTAVFDTQQTYNFTSANFLGLLVYLTRNGETTLLKRGSEYQVSPDSPTLTVLVPLSVGDIVTIREYSNTAGNFVPNTPSKMGLYPKYEPALFLDTNYVNPTFVIQGHDGSITVAFDDIRTQVLLEFEKRIYNNIKTDGNPVPLTIEDVQPGFFRTTDYTQTEITNILSQSFLSWVGWNKLDYKTQEFIVNNPFTWNYSSSGNKINEAPLLGAWRGIYKYFYDTETPNYTPWEMLGFSEEPEWWAERYGPTPYTSDNLVLWDDLEAGLVADPIAPYVLPKYRRPGLTKVIPVGPEGELLAPNNSVMGLYDPSTFRKSWAVGDGGPVEASWWNSSSYPYAVMRLLALTRPAEFFSLFADRDLYRFDAELDQYLYDGRYRLGAQDIEIYGNGVSKASYINWIVDYNQQLGRDSSTRLSKDLSNLDVRLCYRMASFTDKKYLKIFTEKSSPNSQNSSLLLPDESYNLLLYKNQPFAEIEYSALIVERVADGYAVYGYSTTTPFFNIFASSTTGTFKTISAGGTSVRVPTQYTREIVQVPYGYVFSNTTVVVDFILSYGAYLESQGLIFNNVENGYTLNWSQMAQEFLYFSQQGWAEGTMINLNPAATKLMASRPGAVVDNIISITPENTLLDQNRVVLPVRDLVVDRQENTFSVTSTINQVISYLKMRFTSYENMVVLDNVSIFADLLYDPVTAARQNRIRITAATSTEWNGTLDAQGFILNQDNVKEWQPNRKYTKGEVVFYKNIYWSAQTIVQPKAEFDYNDWVKSDYTAIEKGLLPNIANKADQLANSYNTNGANLERDNDLLSYGLIGFRPRQYMQALNLDDVSQVNIYKQFLGTKGTVRAAEIFTRADLGKESGEYAIYENWAILAATYGANANRSFFELRLNEALLQSDPSIVQVIQPQQNSEADQTILLQNVWRESYKLTNTDILPTTYNTTTDTALPSAGYVNLEDVDITVYSLDDPSAISENLEKIGIGTTIWVAKTNAYDWNIYRCEPTPGRITQIQDNLNSTSVATFTAAHKLRVGDTIIIRYFSEAVDGVYRVLATPTTTTIVIAFAFNNTNQTTILGTGLAFYLQTTRVAQASDVANLPYANQLIPGAKAWVDNNGSGHWQVLEKQNQFTAFETLTSTPQVENSRFGAALAQSGDRLNALVGAPGINGATGSVDAFVRNENNSYSFNLSLVLNAPNVVGFGNSVDFGQESWVVAGADQSNGNEGYAAVLYQIPGTGDYVFSQLLNAPDQDFNPIKFGGAVTISNDERWMYVSAPLSNSVYAYGRVDVENQRVIYTTDGVSSTYNYSNFIQIDFANPAQLIVTLNDRILQLGNDYLVNFNSITLIERPTIGNRLVIARRQAIQLDQQTFFNVLATGGTGSGAQFTVDNTRGQYNVILTNAGSGYTAGDLLTISATDVAVAGTDPLDLVPVSTTYVGNVGAVIEINDTTGIVPGMTVDGVGFDSGQYVETVDDLTHVTLNAAPDSTPSSPLVFSHDIKIPVSTVIAGGIVSFDTTVVNRSSAPYGGVTNTVEFSLDPYLYTATSLSAFSVYVNGQLQRPHEDYEFNNDSNDLTRDLTFISIPAPGAVISVVSSTYWQFVDKITVPGLDIDAGFGTSVTTTLDGRTVFIGAPRDSAGGINKPGSVYAFDRSVIRYIVDSATQTTYAIPGNFDAPVSVLLNNQFLTNTDQFINGQFTVSGNNIVLTTPAAVGDVLEIETNQFKLVEKVSAETPIDQAAFGHAVQICPTSCSMYTGAPLDSSVLPQAGSVQRNVNQSRVYGVTTTTNANPSLTVGNTLRINNMLVTVPSDNTVSGLAEAINAANIPNVIATVSQDLEFAGNGTNKIFNIGTTYSSANSYNTVVYVDDVLQTAGVDYTYNNATQQILFVLAPGAGTVITVVTGRLTLSVKNFDSATAFNKLQVLPGTVGTAFEDLGFNTYVYTQTIVSPSPSDYARFGSSLDVDTSAVNLVVGAPNGNIYEPVIFDGGQTIFDDRSTTFFNPVFNSGVVYTFDFLPSATSSINNPGKFVFGQQIFNNQVFSQDEFGSAVNYLNGRLLVGSPGNDAGDSSVNYGATFLFANPNNTPAWTVIHQQQPVVDIYQLNSVFTYDRLTSQTQTYFDFFDPLQGKILGAARRNIDYIGAVDPAEYNVGPIRNQGNSWANEHVGEIWWDTDTVRFIDPNQDDIVYASRRWGQIFPGSRVDIYQWTESSTPPVSYTGPGVPLSTLSYTVNSQLNKDNIFETKYYFWVRGINTISTGAGKTLSPVGVARYIESPRSSGIPYVAPLNSSTVAIYNALRLISAEDTILHIEFDREPTTANVHQEYQLIADGQADAFLSPTLYRKLQDSFCGVNSAGAVVPDPTLSPAEQYGVQFRPRQSMFVNRFTALQNYLGRANTVLAQFPISETKSFSLLNSSDPIPPPTSNGDVIWNKRLINLEELGYQNLAIVPIGYKYLVESDSSQNGLWTIYEVAGDVLFGSRSLELVRVQNYDTRRYWNYIDWYQPGYNRTLDPIAKVPNVSALDTLLLSQVPIGSSVQVTANSQGKFEIYLRTELGWERVGLEDGTIEFKAELWNYALGNFGFDVEVFDAQYFDQEPVIETRQIIRAINEELFVDELLLERNLSLMLMFDYIYTEFEAPEWLLKTSLVDVDHKIRALLPFQNYLQDNQDFVLDYIQEVKPYHVKIREFNLTYDGQDTYPGSLTDFDVPAYWNTLLAIPQFVSPILTPYTASGSTVENFVSNAPANSEIWTLDPWKQWFNNYLLGIQSVNIIAGGAGYTVPPQVTVTGECIEPAEMTAIINSAGQVVGVDVVNPGSGYSTTAIITFTGGNGQGAKAAAVMGNDLVRSIRTVIRYDRFQYRTEIVDWQANVNYDNGTLVRYLDRVWEANSDDSTGVQSATFDLTQWTEVDAGTYQYPGSTYPTGLTGVDRTMGYYAPTVNMPGLQLPLLIDGIDYPGVQVYGVNFNQNTGFDVGNFDVTPFDNISFGPEGQPTYDPGILNAIYESYYGTPATGPIPTGTAFTDINVEGGGYVDTYSSHAPEELIPGSEFDTLDFRVYTRPGSDWLQDGHGFPEDTVKFIYQSSQPQSWAGAFPYPVTILVSNESTGIDLDLNIDYTVDWVNQTVSVTSGATVGDVIVITVYELGGGNQLYKQVYPGTEVSETINIPVNYSEIQEIAMFVNGQPNTNFTYEPTYDPVGIQVVYNPVGSSGTTLVVTSTQGITVGALIEGTGFNGQTVVSKVNATTLLISSAPSTTPSNSLIFRNNLGQTTITFDSGFELEPTDSATVVAIGPTTIAPNLPTVAYSWSAPVTQIINAVTGSSGYTLTNSLQYSNPVNMIVTVNGVRARTAASAEYYSDDSSEFLLPQRLGFSQSLIADNEVLVYVNDIPLVPNVGYTVEPYDPADSARSVILTTLPAPGSRVVVSVITNTQAYVNGNQLIFRPGAGLEPVTGDVIAVTTWNDTRQQDMLTQVIVGPITQGTVVAEGYDETTFDVGTVTGDPGSFDYSVGATVTVNDLDLGRENVDPNRLWVTLNGIRQFPGVDFLVVGQQLILHSGILNPTDVVMITQVTDSVVPEAMAFRIFQDMRGVQATYRITPQTTTTLAEPLGQYDDIIYVTDASALSEPDLSINIWGVLTVNGERIMYRERDTANNTISSLMRGTAGTAAADHAVGSEVYDTGRGNLLPAAYQDYVEANTFTGNASTTEFVTDIVVDNRPIVYIGGSVEVYIDGNQLDADEYTVVQVEPVVVVLDDIPQSGKTVTVTVTYLDSTQFSTNIVASGSTARFVTATNIGLEEQDSSTYVLDDFDPVIVTFDTAPPVGHVVYIRNQRGGENEFDYSFATGTQVTFATTINLSLPVRVFVGGLLQPESLYQVTSLDPVTVVFDSAPDTDLEIVIEVRNGVTWYAPGVGTPSNGVALQDTNTTPARFLRGEI